MKYNTVEGQDHYVIDQDPIEWQPLSLTLVEYPKGDIIGKCLAFISLCPFGIGSGFLALILFRRDLHTLKSMSLDSCILARKFLSGAVYPRQRLMFLILFFIGTLLNEVLNLILKHTICEARPMSRGNLYTDYGMPSSHSQFIWFFTVYVILFVLVRLHHINNNSILSAVWRLIVVGGCLGLSLVVSIGRVYLRYHTIAQVAMGAIVGALFAVLWFFIVHKILTPMFPIIVSWKVCELLMVRDTTLIPNVLWFEYTQSRQEARARGRKLAALKPAQ